MTIPQVLIATSNAPIYHVQFEGKSLEVLNVYLGYGFENRPISMKTKLEYNP
jgi:hypothetical protein